ncbi:glycosyltransferase family 4 protein, partial [Verrucomicrobiota bacterium]
LMEAWAKLIAGGEPANARLLVIGTGPLRRRLEALARRGVTAGSVSFLEGCPHEEIARWMNVADCLCLSSRSEGMPNVVLEALASGLPVVATDVGACAELLNGKPGTRLVEPGRPAALAEAMAEILGAEPDRGAMAAEFGGYGWSDAARRVVGLLAGEPEVAQP